MKEFRSNNLANAIVVGDSADEFVRYTVNLLGGCGIEFVHCEDVYSAVVKSAGEESKNTLVVGRFEELNREQGRFFHKANERGFVCCCLANGDFVRRQKQILAAIITGAFIVNEPSEVEGIVTDMLSGEPACPCGKRKDKKSAFNRDKFLATEAELEALLEV